MNSGLYTFVEDVVCACVSMTSLRSSVTMQGEATLLQRITPAGKDNRTAETEWKNK